MIKALVTMLCGVGSLICILRQQRIIQIQSEQIQKGKELLELRKEQVDTYAAIICYREEELQQLKERFAAFREGIGIYKN